MRRTIPVLALEFDEGGKTIWIQGLAGTVLRIKTTGKITTEECKQSPVSHADILIPNDIHFCLGPDEGKEVMELLSEEEHGKPTT